MKTACPYCGKEQEIDIDDFEEDEKYEYECDCGKHFGFSVGVTIDITTFKADCLNGSPHDMVPKISYPEAFAVGFSYCSVCGEEKKDYKANEAAIREYFKSLESEKKA